MMLKILIYPSQNKYFDRFMALLKQINIERYNYAKTFVQARDQYNACVAYLMLCVLCGRAIGSIKRKENNKPYLDNGYISISHSDNMVAVVVSDEEVGVDCERIGIVSRDIVECTFSKVEQDSAKTAILATKIWTAKEALSKFLNEDFYSTPLTNFEIVNNEIVERNYQELQFSVYQIKDNLISICCKKEENVKFIECDADYILNQLSVLLNIIQ